MLTLTVLVENVSLRTDLIPAKGLSLLLEDGKDRILFDTGPDETFLKNADILGLSMQGIKHIALSHGHYDHAGGIPALSSLLKGQETQPTLTCHPDCFVERHVGKLAGSKPVLVRKLDAGLDDEDVRNNFTMCETRTPQNIGSNFLFLGEIPRNPASKGGKPFGLAKLNGDYTDDYLYDDTAIVWKSKDGLVIITGCSHSGICNIIEHAQYTTGENRIAAVVGGLHLRTAGISHLSEIRKFFQRVDVQHSYACHCTGKWGSIWLPNNTSISTGDVLMFE